jgi:hypothetical protein
VNVSSWNINTTPSIGQHMEVRSSWGVPLRVL